MTTSLKLGEPFDAFIEAQVASGRYVDANDLVRDALRLLAKRASVENAIQEGLADADAVFDELLDELAAAPHFAAE